MFPVYMLPIYYPIPKCSTNKLQRSRCFVLSVRLRFTEPAFWERASITPKGACSAALVPLTRIQAALDWASKLCVVLYHDPTLSGLLRLPEQSAKTYHGWP